MRHLVRASLLAVLVAGCGGGEQRVATRDDASPTMAAARFSDEVRSNFLVSCVQNAKETAGASAEEEQLTQTCECILGRVEQEYSEAEFADFEKRLTAGTASQQESDQLVGWSTDCAEQSAG